MRNSRQKTILCCYFIFHLESPHVDPKLGSRKQSCISIIFTGKTLPGSPFPAPKELSVVYVCKCEKKGLISSMRLELGTCKGLGGAPAGCLLSVGLVSKASVPFLGALPSVHLDLLAQLLFCLWKARQEKEWQLHSTMEILLTS
jgi:hypothetical protein